MATATTLKLEEAPEAPVIKLTPRALMELKLILDNDFTLAGKYFRIVISGKGCNGFTYSVGFTDLVENDVQVTIAGESEDLLILLDPFAAFYLQDATIDFGHDLAQDMDGFVVTNHRQETYTGKFWMDSPEKVPQFTK